MDDRLVDDVIDVSCYSFLRSEVVFPYLLQVLVLLREFSEVLGSSHLFLGKLHNRHNNRKVMLGECELELEWTLPGLRVDERALCAALCRKR